MRILNVSHRYWPYIGGSERYVQEISERLAREGHDVAVYTTDAWDLELFWNPQKRRVGPEAEIHEGVAIRRFAVHHLPWARRSFAGVRWSMAQLSALPVDTGSILRRLAQLAPRVPDLARELATQDGYDIVHGTNIGFEALLWPALAMARRNGAAFVVTPFTHLGETGNDRVGKYYTMRHQHQLLLQADAIIVPTEIERRNLIARGVPAQKIVQAGVGINPREVLGGDAERFRARTGIVRPIVVSLGATAYDKGTFHLVEAMREIWRRGVDADLVLAGPTMDAFVRFHEAQPSWVKERCHVLQFIPEDEKRDLLAACTVLAMPSRTDSFGIAYLEAWLYGKPVIGAWAGGVPEVIDDGRDGFLVQFGDVRALADRLAELIADADLARRLGECGKQKVVERFTWDRIYPIVRDVFHKVAPGGAGRSVI